jgi:hypothetical protein
VDSPVQGGMGKQAVANAEGAKVWRTGVLKITGA